MKNYLALTAVFSLALLGQGCISINAPVSAPAPAPVATVRYNCELSGGAFTNGACVCPIEVELGQTQDMMYDEKTGYCQTTHGGPGGEAAPRPAAAVCPATPQIYFFNKLAFSEAEIASIRANVIAPLVTYYHETDNAEVVSVTIKRTDTGITVEAIVDEFETEDAIYHGFVHPRTGGTYPRWYPEEVPPEYRG